MLASIIVEQLGKKYRISHQSARGYRTLRDELAGWMRSAIRPGRGEDSSGREDFWAVKDVSFEVGEGDRLGIIGRNGAGKSTLLKLMSRITEPTEGRIRLRGKISSLLEVGTGFHPELTGRENIFLNGSILGMARTEIQRKFDQIVDFSGVEKFLDTPVKRYSSGMYVRLAFSVAAHLESGILLVDEVLAVGDAEFQSKCLSRMEEISSSGRTIIFVSHNLSAVQRLCNRGIFMASGRIAAIGPIAAALEAYQNSIAGSPSATGAIDVKPGEVRFVNWALDSSSTGLPNSCSSRDVCRFAFGLKSRRVVDQAFFGFAIWDADGQLVWAGSSIDTLGSAQRIEEGAHEIVFELRLPIKAGMYQLEVSVNGVGEGMIDRWYSEPKLVVLPCGESSLPDRWRGIVNEPLRTAMLRPRSVTK